MKRVLCKYPYENFYVTKPHFNNYKCRWMIHLTHLQTGERVKLHYARYLYETHHGIKLDVDTFVHHIDEDQTNDVIENLEAVNRQDHGRLHAEIARPDYGICNCGVVYVISRKRWTMYLRRQEFNQLVYPMFCSKKCLHKYIKFTKELNNG